MIVSLRFGQPVLSLGQVENVVLSLGQVENVVLSLGQVENAVLSLGQVEMQSRGGGKKGYCYTLTYTNESPIFVQINLKHYYADVILTTMSCCGPVL